MKRLSLSFLILFAMACGAMAQNEAMYVYRNGNLGKLTFLKSEIDSVVCSQVDLQGQRHEEYVVQEIWTRDSVYRTLLSTIDSVSFATVVNTCPDAHHPHAVTSDCRVARSGLAAMSARPSPRPSEASMHGVRPGRRTPTAATPMLTPRTGSTR